MPNRIIKESICVSRKVNSLTAEEEVFFYRLLVNCDDFGTFYGDPEVLAGKLYPRRRCTAEKVKRWRDRLADVGLIRIYEVDGEEYIEVQKWLDHQQKRSQTRKYPYPEGLEDSASECNRVIADDSNGLQMSPKTRTRTRTRTRTYSRTAQSASDVVSLFEAFWAEYPRKVDKADAVKAFSKLVEDGEDPAKVVEAAGRYARHCEDEGVQQKYTKHAATFLREDRWKEWTHTESGWVPDTPREVIRPDHGPTEIVSTPEERIDCREILQDRLKELWSK